MQAWRHGGMEVWRRAASVAIWRNGGLEARCRRRDVDAWRHEALVTRCARGDMEIEVLALERPAHRGPKW